MQANEALINTPAQQAFQLKGSLFTLTIMQITDPSIDRINAQLEKVVAQAPNFFQQAPMVLDLSQYKNPLSAQQLADICRALKDHKISPVGICGSSDEIMRQAAVENHLALFPSQKTEQAANTNPPSDASRKSRLITQPVRSGQQIYAKDSDLIVTSSVSNGAELLADGNIHIYGILKGRALAGVGGDKQARIFCHKLDAELISIAGLYQLNEDFAQKYPSQNMQIYLENDRLCICEL